MKYKEYLRRVEELTREEIANKRTHAAIVDGLEEQRREGVQAVWDRWRDGMRRERASYDERQEEVRARKRELKAKYMASLADEQEGQGKRELKATYMASLADEQEGRGKKGDKLP